MGETRIGIINGERYSIETGECLDGNTFKVQTMFDGQLVTLGEGKIPKDEINVIDKKTVKVEGKGMARKKEETGSLFEEPDTDKFSLETTSGYDFYEVSSAFQKSMRRGLEQDAMYWALELEERYGAYLWKRMIIISHEDMGIVNTEVINFVETCRNQYLYLKAQKNDRHRLLVTANAVLAICRSVKTRIGDDFLNVCLKHPHGIDKKEIPDYALDAHTLRGKKKGRGWDKDGDRFWFEESSVIENEVEGYNTYLPIRRKMIMGRREE